MGIVQGTLIDDGGDWLSATRYGLKGDGSTDNTTAFGTALADAMAKRRRLFLPAGEYLITGPITLPETSVLRANGTPDRAMLCCITGEWMDTLYLGRALGASVPASGTIIRQTTSNTPAIQTSTLTAPNDTSEYWHNRIYLDSLYLAGPGSPAAAGPAGLQLQGVTFARLRNIHVEGFGTGIMVQDAAETWFEGITLAQGNFRGVHLKRQRPRNGDPYDGQFWFENLVTLENQENVVLENPRSVWIQKGENISPLAPTQPRRRLQVIECIDRQTQIHIRDYVIEGHADHPTSTSPTLPPIYVDDKGVGILDLECINYETAALNTLVQCDGDFELIRVARSQLPASLRIPAGKVTGGTAQSGTSTTIRLAAGSLALDGVYNGYQVQIVSGTGAGQIRTIDTYVGTAGATQFTATVTSAWTTAPNNTSVYEIFWPAQEPLVLLSGTVSGAPLSRRVELSDNNPSTAALWVRDASSYADPRADRAPSNLVQLCARPEMDQGNDGRIAFGGTGIGFTTTNKLAGKARLYWSSGSTGNSVQVNFPRPIKGTEVFHLTVICDDNNATSQVLFQPQIDSLQVPGPGDVLRTSGAFVYYMSALETYTVGSRTFRKYGLAVALQTLSSFPNGVTGITVSGFYRGGATSGVEVLNVWVDGGAVGSIVQPPPRYGSAPLASDGYFEAGDRVEAKTPVVTGTSGSQYVVTGWITTAAGSPGTQTPMRTLTGT